MQVDLSGRTAVVTGASSGMGAGIAAGLAGAGAQVLLVGRNRERLSRSASAASAGARAALVVEADITEEAGVAAVVAASAAFPKLDVLVHAAGVYEPMPFSDTPMESLDRQWRINVRAPFALTQALLPSFHGQGAVIFVTSIAGHIGFPNSVAYCATKGGEELLSKALAMELAPLGIRVNAIAPGNIHTPMNAHLFAQPGWTEQLIGDTPAGRIGEVEDIVPAVVFLASSAAQYMFGASMVVDGGWVAR
ncbi:MAG TPA: SDR family oxidoreductase [Candidatus Acidoferrales bacterium]|nr:SDR family oxidoreductase [Candidatus Acidoferrales bacterium]